MTGDAPGVQAHLLRPASRVPVIVAASGASWEPELLDVMAREGRGLVLVKRCLDLPDLLATAASGSSRVAVVSDQLPGLDADSVRRLRDRGVRVLAVLEATPNVADHAVSARTRLARLGVAAVVAADALHEVPAEVAGLGDAEPEAQPVGPSDAAALSDDHSGGSGRLVAVWGAHGSPGRTTLALCLAAHAAATGRHALILDADPYGGALAQHLAVLDGTSGLLAASRMANTGQLDRLRLAGLAREVGPRLRLLTGLPRPDRWTEVRVPAFGRLLDVARELDEVVVVDTGAGLPSTAADPFATLQQRDDITLAALQEADEVLVVTTPDPVGMTRLARALPALREVRPAGAVHVVVNRMRAGLRWSEREIAALVTQVDASADVAFVPEDQAAADRALLAGTSLWDAADPVLRRALAATADRVLGQDAPARPSRRGRRLLLRR